MSYLVFVFSGKHLDLKWCILEKMIQGEAKLVQKLSENSSKKVFGTPRRPPWPKLVLRRQPRSKLAPRHQLGSNLAPRHQPICNLMPWHQNSYLSIKTQALASNLMPWGHLICTLMPRHHFSLLGIPKARTCSPSHIQ